LLATPYLLHYDMLIIMLPLAWMLRSWMDTGFPPWSKAVLILTLCAPATYVVSGPVAFGAPMLLLFGGYLVWVEASRPAPAAGWQGRSQALGGA